MSATSHFPASPQLGRSRVTMYLLTALFVVAIAVMAFLAINRTEASSGTGPMLQPVVATQPVESAPTVADADRVCSKPAVPC